MPCTDYGSYDRDEANSLRKKLDLVTRLLCETLTQIDESGSLQAVRSKRSQEVQKWWEEHQEADRRRRADEAAELRRINAKKAALAKLTPAERLLLGLK